jgi:hypothetical protein
VPLPVQHQELLLKPNQRQELHLLLVQKQLSALLLVQQQRLLLLLAQLLLLPHVLHLLHVNPLTHTHRHTKISMCKNKKKTVIFVINYHNNKNILYCFVIIKNMVYNMLMNVKELNKLDATLCSQ